MVAGEFKSVAEAERAAGLKPPKTNTRTAAVLELLNVLKPEELANLKSQSVISSLAHGGHRLLPRAFTEHGAVIGGGLHRSSIAPVPWE